VLVVAKNDSAHQALSEQFQNRTMIKIYLAYVSGVPHAKMGSWKWPIIRHAVHRHKMTALKNPSDAEKGRHALTDYCVKKSWKRTSQLELRLHTGRTHQIRVHSATAGHSVIGDAVYGKPAPWWKEASVTRQLLHAHKLKLEHRRKTVEFIAPVPDDFTAFENWLNQHES
jgi:23S rRNA pseudouridine1911/1915/1917 synthase